MEPSSTIATVPPPLPEFNPDKVVIKCHLLTELHGFHEGEVVTVLQKRVNRMSRDINGFDIWVHSPRFNRSVWLSSSEYSLVETPTNGQ